MPTGCLELAESTLMLHPGWTLQLEVCAPPQANSPHLGSTGSRLSPGAHTSPAQSPSASKSRVLNMNLEEETWLLPHT